MKSTEIVARAPPRSRFAAIAHIIVLVALGALATWCVVSFYYNRLRSVDSFLTITKYIRIPGEKNTIYCREDLEYSADVDDGALNVSDDMTCTLAANLDAQNKYNRRLKKSLQNTVQKHDQTAMLYGVRPRATIEPGSSMKKPQMPPE